VPAAQPNDQQKKWPDPVSRHGIDLGDGRWMQLSRSNRWQQMQIRFIPQREDVDPRPSKQDTAFLKEHSWRWRGDRNEKYWSRQLEKNTPENPDARANSDRDAELQFVELANRIRQRNGLEPVSYSPTHDRA
jgi:uncharacterized protein YkwD